MSRERSVVEDGDAPGDARYVEGELISDRSASEVDVTRALCARVVELERELERRERQHERVVARYEELLAKTRGETDDDDGLIGWVRSLY